MITPIDRTADLMAALAAHHDVPAAASTVFVSVSKLTPSSSASSSSSSSTSPGTGLDGVDDAHANAHMTKSNGNSSNNNNNTNPKPADAFTQAACDVAAQLHEMTRHISSVERRYKDVSVRGMSDDERDAVDARVGRFVSDTVQTIDVLKAEAVDLVQQSPGASFAAHRLGVVVLLNERLGSVSSQMETFRAFRIHHALNMRDRQRKMKRDAELAKQQQQQLNNVQGGNAGGDNWNASWNNDDFDNGDDDHQQVDASRKQRHPQLDGTDTASSIRHAGSADDDMGNNDGENDAALMLQFKSENRTLFNDLVQTREQVHDAERTMTTIASMNQAFATAVVQQAREIEVLYGLAVEATRLVDRGNVELRRMGDRRPILKYVLALLALVLAAVLLVSEWVTRRRLL